MAVLSRALLSGEDAKRAFSALARLYYFVETDMIRQTDPYGKAMKK